jgi:hypothetical protein
MKFSDRVLLIGASAAATIYGLMALATFLAQRAGWLT